MIQALVSWDMDFKTLSPLPDGLTIPSTQRWLMGEFMQRLSLGGLPDAHWAGELMRRAPEGLAVTTELAEALVIWLDDNGLREDVREGKTLSMKGVAFGTSKLVRRRSPEEAWQTVAQVLAKARWINNAPDELVSMRVADVLLFGSMSQPGKPDHGDMDAVIIFEPKSTGSDARTDALFQAHQLRFAMDDSGYVRIRAVLEKMLVGGDGFVAIDSLTNTVTTLLGQDPDFACYSLMGKAWTAESLDHTTADEDTWGVMQALDNGTLTSKALIRDRLKQANAQLGLDVQDQGREAEVVLARDIKTVAKAITQGHARGKPTRAPSHDRAVWWASLGGEAGTGVAMRLAEEHTVGGAAALQARAQAMWGPLAGDWNNLPASTKRPKPHC